MRASRVAGPGRAWSGHGPAEHGWSCPWPGGPARLVWPAQASGPWRAPGSRARPGTMLSTLALRWACWSPQDLLPGCAGPRCASAGCLRCRSSGPRRRSVQARLGPVACVVRDHHVRPGPSGPRRLGLQDGQRSARTCATSRVGHGREAPIRPCLTPGTCSAWHGEGR